MKNWYCMCGNFVREKRFCPRCKFMRFSLEKAPILDYWGLKVGATLDGLPFNLPLGLLLNHVLVTGQTGTGKTRFAMNLIVKAENNPSIHPIKFLAIDVEGEWKNIIPKMKEKSEYYSVESNLKINPFDLEDPALIRELMRQTVFKGIEKEYVDLSAQMNFVLQETIHESKNMQELIDNIKSYDKQKLTALAKTKTALLVRLDPFMRSPLKEIFMCKKSNPSLERLGERNMIIDLHELDKLVAYNPEVRLIYNVITTYFLRKMLNRDPSDNLSNLFVCDEAQLLAPKILRKLIVTETWPATEIGVRLRKRSVGLVMITQRPSNLERDIVDNCATKISFRMQNQEDIRILCDTVGFTDIVELEYLTDKFVNLKTKNAIVCTAGHEPFLITADDFEIENYAPVIIQPQQNLLELQIQNEYHNSDETAFLGSLEKEPFLSVRDRKAILGWDFRRYSQTVESLLTKGIIEKVEVGLGRGSPRILYQKSGSIPGIRHEFYVNWIVRKLKEKGLDTKTNKKEGPDIEIPEVGIAIEVELGKSNMEANVLRDIHKFKKVIVCSDQKQLLDTLSGQINSSTVLFSLIQNVLTFFDKKQDQKDLVVIG